MKVTLKNMVLAVCEVGYTDSYVMRRFIGQGLAPMVLNDLSSGYTDTVSGSELIFGHVADVPRQDNIFTNHILDAVKYFASLIKVGESVINSVIYYDSNISRTLCLLAAMKGTNPAVID